MAMVLRQSQESGRIEALSLPGSDLVLNGVYYWQPDLLSLEEIKKTLSSEGAGTGSS
jgi:hypothetical protein